MKRCHADTIEAKTFPGSSPTEVQLLVEYILTMVLKQCHSRFKTFGINYPEKWYDLSFNQNKVSSLVSAHWTSSPPCLTAVDTSPCVQCLITPPLSNSDKPTWRQRRAPGQKIIHLSTVTQVSTRGNVNLTE